MNNLETNLYDIKKNLTLSTSEKALGRAALQEFMEFHPSTGRPAVSPYTRFVPIFRYALAVVLLLGVSGTGVAFAAEKALPGTPLYAVKTQINEPVSVALTFDTQDRADLKVALVEKRLKEFAQLTNQDDVSPETTATIVALLEKHIQEASDDIDLLQEGGDSEEALQTNADLQSTLIAHSAVLEKVQDAHVDSPEDFVAVTAAIEKGIASSALTEDDITETLSDVATPTTIEDVAGQESETQTSLDELTQSISSSLDTLDQDDRDYVEGKLHDVDAMVTEARLKNTDGDEAGAFILFNEAQQELEQLQTLIQAERDL
ncbi:hypothetical protein KKH15_00700, partial [Patescibacteria group bacterium]|nr:hypothetical protein [Patescibacteria group bacterium]MBU1755240.1 hypothetical protein [Patescibacteria group bacterium]